VIPRLLCWLGLAHRDQVLYEPPHLSTTGAYRKGVWCVYCGREWKRPAPRDVNSRLRETYDEAKR